MVKIEHLYLSKEKEHGNIQHVDEANENTDVVILLNNGKKYIATFFTYLNIEKIRQLHRQTGEYLSGTYFRVENMVLVERCTKEEIKKIVEHMIDEGDFYSTFREI